MIRQALILTCILLPIVNPLPGAGGFAAADDRPPAPKAGSQGQPSSPQPAAKQPPAASQPGTSPSPPAPKQPSRPPAAAPSPTGAESGSKPAPSQPPAPGKVTNGGFEKGLDGWQLMRTEKDYIIADGAAAKSGDQALRLWSPCSGVNPWVSQDIPLPGKPGWLSVQLHLRPTLRNMVRVVVRLELLAASGKTLSKRYLQAITSDPARWRPLKGRLLILPEAAKLRLTIRLVGTGGVWVDDVHTQFAHAPILLVPRRIATIAGRPCKVSLRILAAPQDVIRATIGDKQITATRRSNSLTLSIPALEPGRASLTISAGDDADSIAIWTTPADRKPRMLSESGWWDISGRPTFLNLLLHARLPELMAVAERGFTAAEVFPASRREHMRSMLRSLPKNVPHLVIPAPFSVSPERWEESVRRFIDVAREAAGDRRVAAWIIADEPDVRLDGDRAPDLYLQARAVDHLHPLLVVLATTSEARFYGRFADGVLLNLCSRGASASEVFARLQELSSRLEAWQAYGAVLPAGWSPAAPPPDPARLRCLAFAAIAAGSRVIAWYAMHATGWDLRASALWAQFRGINDDIATVSTAIADRPPATDVSVAASGLVWAAWDAKDSRVLLLVNDSPAPASAKVTCPAAVSEAKLMLGKAKPQVADNLVTVSVPGSGVVCLRLQLGKAIPRKTQPAPEGAGARTGESSDQAPAPAKPRGPGSTK